SARSRSRSLFSSASTPCVLACLRAGVDSVGVPMNLAERAAPGHMVGLLKVRVLRGVNLAVRDLWSSDPYVILKMGKQEVYDKDTFSLDDRMGSAEFDIHPFVEAVKMNLVGLPNGTIIRKVVPCRRNCLAEESHVYWSDGEVVQDLFLRLRNVECGEVELQLHWISIPGSGGL
ncbi:hypothetical protein BHE74_00044137, partial [Ensete ventricosum]